MRDLTVKVEAIVGQSRITIGIAHLVAVGGTAGIGTMEFAPGLKKDLPEILNKVIPPGRQYDQEQT